MSHASTMHAMDAGDPVNQAQAAFQAGDWAQALAGYERVLASDATVEVAALQAARCLVHLQRWVPARKAFAHTLRLNPANYSAWLEAGHLCRRMGKLRQAMAAYQRAIDASPDRPEALEAALLLAEEADELRIELGETLLRIGQADRAFDVLAPLRASTSEATLARLAEQAFRHHRWAEAIAIARHCTQVHPSSPWAHWNLAHVLAESWHLGEAEVELSKAEALAPVPRAVQMRASLAGRRGDADAALALHLESARRPDAPDTAIASAAMASLYSDRLSAREVTRLHQQLFAPLGQGARACETFRRAPLGGRRVRLGFVSADLHHQHPVNLFMQPVLREFDRERFELFLYDDCGSPDDQARLARSRVDQFIDATRLDNAQLARRIDADGIDLLVDLAGHTWPRRTALFAQRAAPVQATYLGYPGTTGIPNMDWLIGDEVVTPLGCDDLYSERIARLPGTVFCFAPETDHPFPEHAPAQAGRLFTFGSFNNLPKLTERTVRLWARVLAAVPHSRLLLKAPSLQDPGAVELMQQRFSALGVGADRIEFRGATSLPAMMAEYAEVDIALDPVPYNGGTTSLQALWMGAPVLSMEGSHFVSRMGASFMRAAGLDDWVASDDADYVARALAHATDRDRLLSLKKGLRQRLLTRRGWDVRAHTRALEQAFLDMLNPQR